MAANILANLGDWSTSDASNQPDGTDTTDIAGEYRRIQAVVRKYLATATTLAAGATTDLATAAGNTVTLTGAATTISSFGTVSAGLDYTIIANAAHTLTYNATSMILPTSADITLAAGDVLVMTSEGSGNWRCKSFTRANGAPLDAELAAIAGLTSAADTVPYFTGSGTAGLKTLGVASGNIPLVGGGETVPAGAVMHFAMSSAPTGWLKADGSAVSRTTYAVLFEAVGTTFGAGDGSTTFNLPDLRGEFIRGWDDARGVDSGRGFGSVQGDAMRDFSGNLYGIGGQATGNPSADGVFLETGSYNGGGSAGGGTANNTSDFNFTASRTGVPVADENRPRNIALLACIKH